MSSSREVIEKAEALAAKCQAWYASLPPGSPDKARAFKASAVSGKLVAHLRANLKDTAGTPPSLVPVPTPTQREADG